MFWYDLKVFGNLKFSYLQVAILKNGLPKKSGFNSENSKYLLKWGTS